MQIPQLSLQIMKIPFQQIIKIIMTVTIRTNTLKKIWQEQVKQDTIQDIPMDI